MVSYKKVLVLFSVSKIVGEIVKSGSRNIFVNAYDPLTSVSSTTPKTTVEKSHYDSPRIVETLTKSGEKSSVPMGCLRSLIKRKHEETTSEDKKEEIYAKINPTTKKNYAPKSILKIPHVEGQMSIDEMLKKRVSFNDPLVIGPGSKVVTEPKMEKDSVNKTPEENKEMPPPVPKKNSQLRELLKQAKSETSTEQTPKKPVEIYGNVTITPSKGKKILKSDDIKPAHIMFINPMEKDRCEKIVQSGETPSSDHGKKTCKEDKHATITPAKGKEILKSHVKDESTFASYGKASEDSHHGHDLNDEHIYEELPTGSFIDEHKPTGYSEHFYVDPYKIDEPVKSTYQKFKENARGKLQLLKTSAKSKFQSESKKDKDSSKKTKKGKRGFTLRITAKPSSSKKVSEKSEVEEKDKIVKATEELIRESDKLSEKLGEEFRPKFSDFKESTSRTLKGAQRKTKKELKKIGSSFSDIGKDLKGEVIYIGKKTKQKLQGAKHKTSKELNRIRDGVRSSVTKTSDSVAGYVGNQIGIPGNYTEVTRL